MGSMTLVLPPPSARLLQVSGTAHTNLTLQGWLSSILMTFSSLEMRQHMAFRFSWINLATVCYLIVISKKDFLRLLTIFLAGGQGVLSLGWDSAFLKAAVSIGAAPSEPSASGREVGLLTILWTGRLSLGGMTARDLTLTNSPLLRPTKPVQRAL